MLIMLQPRCHGRWKCLQRQAFSRDGSHADPVNPGISRDGVLEDALALASVRCDPMSTRSVRLTIGVFVRRSVKYGLYGALAAGVVGGTAAFAFAASGTPITLVVDGQTKKIDTSAHTVQGALHGAGYTVGAHDIVAPSLDSDISSGST